MKIHGSGWLPMASLAVLKKSSCERNLTMSQDIRP
jgi:hypothetical protein